MFATISCISSSEHPADFTFWKSSDVTAPRSRTIVAANFKIASIFGSLDPAIRHLASVSSFMPAPLPIAVKAERQYAQPLISETAIAIWYRVSNGNTPPSSVSERSEEHTSELQSQSNLVCRLLLEKKNIKEKQQTQIRCT